MSNIVPRTSAVGRAKDDDWGDVDKGQSVSLSVRVGQEGSTKYKPGVFNFYKEAFPAQERLSCVVVIFPHKSRVLYGERIGDKIVCKSDNFHQPSPYVKNPVSSECAVCPKAKWTQSSKGEQERPECGEVINLVVVDEKMIPFKLSFERSQLKKVQTDLINKIRFMGKRPYQVMFDLGLKKVPGKKGKFYFEYSFENFRNVPAEEEPKYQELFVGFKATGEQAIAKHHEEMEERDAELPPVPPFNSDEEIPF